MVLGLVLGLGMLVNSRWIEWCLWVDDEMLAGPHRVLSINEIELSTPKTLVYVS